MTENTRGGGPPFDDPRDYDLPTTVITDKPDADELPEDVSLDEIPDTETIEEYTGPADEFREDTDLVNAISEIVDSDDAIRVATVLYNHGTEMHPQEIGVHADVPAGNLPRVLDTLRDAGLIRQTRTADIIPFYEFFGMSEAGMTVKTRLQ